MSTRGSAAYETVSVAIDVIRFLKSRYNYRKLSSMLGIPQSTLSRYVRGETVPSPKHVRRILDWAESHLKPEQLVREYVNGEDLVELATIAAEPMLVRLLAGSAFETFSGRRILGVLSMDQLVLPIATAFSLLTGTKLYQLSERPHWGREKSIPIVFRQGGEPYSGSGCLWCPSSIGEVGEGVLLMTLAVTQPSPLTEVLKTLEEKRVHVTGIFTLVAKRRVWNSLRVPVACKKHAVLELS
jgi:transcriptional regulator with XRE-family HTH domain